MHILISQNQAKFDFGEELLLTLLFNVNSHFYGTFLMNSDAERAFSNIQLQTNSVWERIDLAPTQQNVDGLL